MLKYNYFTEFQTRAAAIGHHAKNNFVSFKTWFHVKIKH